MGSPDAECARTRERQRLAVELHGSLAQSLFAIAVEAELGSGAPDAATRGRALREVARLAAAARRELYVTLTRLNDEPDDRPLRIRLDEAIGAFSRASGIAAALTVSGPVRPLGPVRDELVRDTLDDALRNVGKHTLPGADGARQVIAELAYRADAVRLRVRNDGTARPARRDPDRDAGTGGLGLLAARATRLGGRLDLELSPAERDGAVLCLDLPITTTQEGTR